MTLRVMVTGATGFVGRPLVARLAAAGHTVAAVANTGGAPDAATTFVVDVRDREAFAGAPFQERPRER